MFVNEPAVSLASAAEREAATNEALTFAAYTFTMCRFKKQRNQDQIFEIADDLFAILGYNSSAIGCVSRPRETRRRVVKPKHAALAQSH